MWATDYPGGPIMRMMPVAGKVAPFFQILPRQTLGGDMPLEHTAVLLNAAAILIATAIGWASTTLWSAARDAFGVWVVLMFLAVSIPYITFDIVMAIGAGIAFVSWAVLAHAVRSIFRRRAT